MSRQENCAPCIKVPDDVKMKVIEILKPAHAKKETKHAGFLAVADDVHLGQMNMNMRMRLKVHLKGPNLDPSPPRPQDQWISLLKEFRKSWQGLLKQSKLLWTLSKGRKEGNTSLDILGNDFLKPGFPSIPLSYPHSNQC